MTATLTIRALRLTVETAGGVMGNELRFGPGLNLIRADNSSGKTTALMGIVYALGLEGMLSPSHRVPLAHAMTDRLDVNGATQRVVSSSVALEIENGEGQIITVSRAVIDPRISGSLITVHDGPAITSPDGYPASDYFVRVRGGAQNEAGFHRFLAEFLGLMLPKVTRVDGSEIPLYLEVIFPYFFVEQKHGWSSIQARLPTYLGIRDVHRRSAEFVLGLGALDRARARQRLKSNMIELETDWQTTCKSASDLARLSQVVLVGAGVRISNGVSDSEFVPSVVVGDKWLELGAATEMFQAQLAAESTSPATVGDASAAIAERLARLEVELRQILAVAATIAEEREELELQDRQLSVRLEALDEDLLRHQDSDTLRRLGSEHAEALLADHVCPTCHQELADGADISTHTMSTAENIDFIKRQLSTFKASQSDLRRVLAAIITRQTTLVSDANEVRQEIRAARDALTSASATPSAADVARRLNLESRIADLQARAQEFTTLRSNLIHLSERWREQKTLLGALGTDDLSAEDDRRLDALQDSVREQLAAYGFDSLRPNEIEIDKGSYRPTHEGFDLGFDLSASDMIRVIWAYLFAMLNVGRMAEGANHLGLLVFDEPKQQDTARESYRGLLAHAATAGSAGSQVIFATSEPLDSLKELLGSATYELLSLDPGHKLLQYRGPSRR